MVRAPAARATTTTDSPGAPAVLAPGARPVPGGVALMAVMATTPPARASALPVRAARRRVAQETARTGRPALAQASAGRGSTAAREGFARDRAARARRARGSTARVRPDRARTPRARTPRARTTGCRATRASGRARGRRSVAPSPARPDRTDSSARGGRATPHLARAGTNDHHFPAPTAIARRPSVARPSRVRGRPGERPAAGRGPLLRGVRPARDPRPGRGPGPLLARPRPRSRRRRASARARR
jgi:hypothetical protein